MRTKRLSKMVSSPGSRRSRTILVFPNTAGSGVLVVVVVVVAVHSYRYGDCHALVLDFVIVLQVSQPITSMKVLVTLAVESRVKRSYLDVRIKTTFALGQIKRPRAQDPRAGNSQCTAEHDL